MRVGKTVLVSAIIADQSDDDRDGSSQPYLDAQVVADPASQRDTFVELARADLKVFFQQRPESVFYQRQLQVIFEHKYFHWVTVRALSELVSEGSIAVQPLPFVGTRSGRITIYRATSYRYWRRAADEVVRLVSQFSNPSFTSGLGAHGEGMFDAALPTAGFMPVGRNTKAYGGLEWTKSKHDLDRIFERDGVAYGTEIKNTLGYIERDELEIKARMCKYLGLRPLFVVRMAPKSYVNYVSNEGGFTLIFKYQLYPFGQKAFADEVKARLSIPADSPARISDGTVQRLLTWHLKTLERKK